MKRVLTTFGWLLLALSVGSANGDDQSTAVFDAGAGEVYGVDLSPDGKLIAATSSSDPARVRIWEVSTKKVVMDIDAGSPPLGDVKFARTGNTLVFVNGLGRIVVWDTRRKVQLREWPVENSGVGRFALSKNGRFMLLTNGVGAAWIDLQTGRVVTEVRGNTRVRAVALSADEKSFATGDDQGNVHLWDIRNGKKLADLPKQRGSLQSLAFSPDGKLLAVGAADFPIVWSMEENKVAYQLDGAPEFPRSVGFTSDGTLLCTVGYPQEVILWSMETGKKVHAFAGHTADVYSLAFSANDKQLVTGSVDKTVRIWDLSEFTGKPAAKRPKRPEPKKSVVNEHINDLKNWEIVRGEWKQTDGRIVGSGNSRLNYTKTLPNDLTLRVKLRVIEGMRPRIRFGSFHFGNEGPKMQLFLHGPKATGEPFAYKMNEEIRVEVTIADETATLKINGKEVATSHPKTKEDRTISLETGGTSIPGTVEFYDFEIITE